MNIAQPILHYFFHFGFPLLIAFLFFKKDWKKVYLLFLATMLIDLDHLFATPIFEANRCSINFHFLHSFYAVPFYIAMLFFRRTIRLLGMGLLWHLVTDTIDCVLMYGRCAECLETSPALSLLQTICSIFGC